MLECLQRAYFNYAPYKRAHMNVCKLGFIIRTYFNIDVILHYDTRGVVKSVKVWPYKVDRAGKYHVRIRICVQLFN